MSPGSEKSGMTRSTRPGCTRTACAWAVAGPLKAVSAPIQRMTIGVVTFMFSSFPTPVEFARGLVSYRFTATTRTSCESGPPQSPRSVTSS